MKKILIITMIFFTIYDAAARKLVLTKIGGNGQLSLPIGMPANGTPSPTNVLTFQEGVNGFPTSPSTNWSTYLSYFSDCINSDPENDLLTVEYKIDVESPSLTNPLIIGEQFIDINGLWQCKKNINLNGTQAIAAQTNSTTTPINKVTIRGINGGSASNAYIKYADGLRYGSYIKPNSNFNYYIITKISNNAKYYSTTNSLSYWPAAQYTISAVQTHQNNTPNYQTLNNITPIVTGGAWKNTFPNYAYIHNFFSNTLSNNVSVDQISINGNSNNFVQWTMYGDVGRQIAHSGFTIYNSTNVSINNCTASYMGLDGVMLTGTCNNITINKSIFEYNGRQGLSWVGGNNIKVSNSQFNYTGKGLVASAPGAGMDIEPEGGYSCTNGTFTNCEYKYNAGCGVVADNAAALSSTHTFNNCTFVGTTSWSLWATHKDMNFIGSKFYGSAVHLRGSPIVNEATYFEKCTFSDCFKNENGLNIPVYYGNASYKPLIEGTGNYENATFYQCNFNAFNGAAMYIDNSNPNKFNIDQCIFKVAWCNNDNIIIRRANFTNNTYTRCAGTCNCSFAGCGCGTNNTFLNNTFNFWGVGGVPAVPTCCSTRIYNPLIDDANITPNLILNIKNDFCAKGDGITDDNGAFVAASNFINARQGKCELQIPYGIYRVGRQLINYTVSNSNPYLINSMPVIELKNCFDTKVIGLPNANGDQPQLLFNDNLYFGTFDNVTLQSTNSIAPYYDASKLANLKACVNLIDCNNTEISNIILDGNFYPGKVNIGGQYGWAGYQINHNGINIINSSNTVINELDVHHFGVDGIAINNNLNSDNVTINNSNFNYNARTGLALRGGKGLTVNGGQFNYTGMGLISSSYMSGIEIVPISGSTNVCTNSNFSNCEIKLNKGIGLNLANTSPNTFSHSFANCIIVGSTNWSAWIKQRDVNFANTKFYGTLVHSYPSSQYGDATSYIGCQFSDCYYENGSQVNTYFGNVTYKPLIEGEENLENVNFTNCNFQSYNGASIWFKNTNPNSFLFLNGCTFNNTWNHADNVILSRAHLSNNTFNSFGNYNCSFQPSCNNSNVLIANTFNTWNVNGNPIAPTCNAANYKQVKPIDENKEDNMTIYPNPAKNELNLIFSTSSNHQNTLYIYNSLGQEVMNKQINVAAGKVTLDVSQLSTGNYFAVLKNTESVQHFKFTKE